MESRLTATMRTTIDNSIQDALRSMQISVENMVQTNPIIQSQNTKLKGLEEENVRLNRKVLQLSTEQARMKKQLSKIESVHLERSLIVRGIPEEYKETKAMICDKLHVKLIPIMLGNTEDDKFEAAKKILIRSCKQLGRYNRNRIRPLSVELVHKEDIEFVLENRFNLERGIYIDREYPKDIERRRKTLLPVLRAAKKLPRLQ